MKLYASILLAALSAGAIAQGLEYAAMPTRSAALNRRVPICAEDSCPQAVQQTAFCSCIRQGKEDCVSYFSTTVTPETV